MSSRKFRRPDFVICTARVRVFPGVGNVEWATDDAGAHFFAEQAFQQIFVNRQSVLRKNRVPEFLELVEDLVIQTRVVMIGAPEHDDADAIFPLELIEDLASFTANTCLVILERGKSRLNSSLIFVGRETEKR